MGKALMIGAGGVAGVVAHQMLPKSGSIPGTLHCQPYIV